MKKYALNLTLCISVMGSFQDAIAADVAYSWTNIICPDPAKIIHVGTGSRYTVNGGPIKCQSLRAGSITPEYEGVVGSSNVVFSGTPTPQVYESGGTVKLMCIYHATEPGKAASSAKFIATLPYGSTTCDTQDETLRCACYL